MRNYSTRQFRWEDTKVMHGKKDTGFGLYEYGDDLWKVKYPDGSASEDYYNLTRAKEHGILEAYRFYQQEEERHQAH